MVSHIETFFNPLTEKLKDKCDFGFYTNNKNTYITYRAANDIEVAVIITTKFNPQNTVRIQFVSDECIKKQPKRLASDAEIKKIEEALGVKLTDESNRPAPADTAKNGEEYTYYRMLFPFTNSPVEVLDEVADALIKIFTICETNK